MRYPYLVRFRLLGNNRLIDEITYCSETDPCSKDRAMVRLVMLWGDTKQLYKTSQWKTLLRAAFDALKAALEYGDRPYQVSFAYLGKTYTLEVNIEAGSGHFGRFVAA